MTSAAGGIMSLETAVTSVERPTAPQVLQSWWRFVLRTLFIAMLAVYVGWNVYWLGQLRIAPSLFQSLTGLPCPTTGCTRSFFALCHGEWRESLRFNALLVPICALLIATVLQLIGQFVTWRRLSLSNVLVVLWGIVLPLAWVLKLAGDPRYW
ncbi:MAG: DUF2752 domain-containing protein [Pirellulaceae bacterium]|nr:DUF2752 domain-containing protein [Pirellulaceae bacterium]